MVRIGIAVAVVGVLGTLLVGCGETEQAGFIWQPDLGQEYGSDVAGRSAFGIVDGDGGFLYFQALNGGEAPLYSLYALNEATSGVEELVADCYGMVNASGDAVFYRGEMDQGVLRYDRRTKAVSKVYDGGVDNLLATKDQLYIVSSDRGLWQLDSASGGLVRIADNVAAHYLEYVDGDVYFAQLKPDDMHCSVCKIEAGSPGEILSVYEGIPYPMQMVGTRVLYGDGRGVHLLDVNSREETTVCSRDSGAGPPAVNGNGVFFCRTDSDGHLELCVFDLETERTTCLLPVHCAAPYFVDGDIYLVNPVDLGFERVILDADDPHTEWVVESEVGPR